MEVIKAILQWLSDQPEPAAEIPNKLHAGPSIPSSVISYHTILCEEAGFIRRSPANSNSFQLTWKGHDKIDDLVSNY